MHTSWRLGHISKKRTRGLVNEGILKSLGFVGNDPYIDFIKAKQNNTKMPRDLVKRPFTFCYIEQNIFCHLYW